ncbi:restriction endonuclease subunit S [Marispirochaeta sp.]|uniref:restriction endonuclease subunit S n=1 Tax=Marispirochaeta sp. TaxID=2038653 RepID=UPI0029C8430D|nr:restriction endonuclease subunit S [Marispirochaeta sp.]
MSRKQYPTYKPSGVQWLGDVPEHWEVKRTCFMLSLNPSKKEIDYLSPETELAFLPMEAVGEDGTLRIDTKRPVYEVSSGYTYFSEGDVTFAKITPCFENGKGAIMRDLGTEYGFGTTELTVLRPGPKLHNEYLYFLTISRDFRKNGEAWMYGAGGQKRVPDDFVKEFQIGFPPLPEQQAIASFLDRETGRIDALIDKKKRLIALLKEKRSAMISRAVIKGLDHSVKMKPSGVPWLGDAPEGWEVLPIKRIVSTPVTDGPHETPEILDEGIPFVSAEAVRNNKIDFNKKRGFISEDDHRRFSLKYHPKRNDIYMIKSGATTGNLAIVETDEEFNIWSPLAVIRCHYEKSDPRFVLSAMNSREFQTSVQLFWSYGTQQNIGMNVVQNLVLPIPPLPEQQAIAAFLDRETEKIDSLVAKVETAIERLKEYRTSLISSAVTGKIDVRERI